MMIDYYKIVEEITKEKIDKILKKAYCTVIFTANYVLKFFEVSNYSDIKNEFLWDYQYSVLSVELLMEKVDGQTCYILKMNRIEDSTNVLNRLLKEDLSNFLAIKIGVSLKDVFANYRKIDISPKRLHENFMINYKNQLIYLRDKLFSDTIIKLEELLCKNNLLKLFYDISKISSAFEIHGNLFCGNIFYYHENTVIIDPISNSHIAKKSYKYMDLANYLVDLFIFKKEKDYNFIFKSIVCNMSPTEILIIRIFLLLKLLVRLRFAYLEINPKNEDEYCKFNSFLILNCEELIRKECICLIDEINYL